MTDYVIKERLFRLPMVLARALQEFEVRRQKEAAIAQIRAAAWREAMINRIVQTMRGTLVLDEVLQTTVDQLQDVLQVSYGLICRPEFHHQTRSCYVSQGTRERQGLIEVHYHFCGYYQQRLDRDEAVVLNRIDCQPRGELEETARDCGIRSLTIVPLIYQQSYLGEISLHQCDRQRNWTADELALVRAIADHCAIAIHQVQLYQQAQTELAERQRMEVALAQQASELARSNAELAQFAYVASHDLQEPLGIVASYTQLLAKRYRGQLDAKADKFITYIVEGVTRMQTLIQDLLGYSYLGRASKNFQPTDCKAACDLAIANLKIAIQKSGATITLGELPTVMADATQLVQLFQNLIGNGIKYRSNKPPFVEVKAQRQEDKWLFSVRDNGIGIEPQYAERIFMIFQRLHTREEYPGTGIGLAICKKIVEHHGGRIWMESQLGHGATFYFTIPQEG
ncbi:MAG TPA: histidine kinase [Cyanobacteria bacterium UBA8803]|nr:histidine kinase [Cyanobacteria bacterium UBA8803]